MWGDRDVYRPDNRRPIPILLKLRVCLNNKRNTCRLALPSPLPPQAGSALRALLLVAPSSPPERSSLVLIPRLLICPAGPLRLVWSDSSWEGYIHWQVPAGAALMVTWSGVSRGCLAGASAPVVSPAGWSPWFSSVQSVAAEESMFIVGNVWFQVLFNKREVAEWIWQHKISIKKHFMFCHCCMSLIS